MNAFGLSSIKRRVRFLLYVALCLLGMLFGIAYFSSFGNELIFDEASQSMLCGRINALSFVAAVLLFLSFFSTPVAAVLIPILFLFPFFDTYALCCLYHTVDMGLGELIFQCTISALFPLLLCFCALYSHEICGVRLSYGLRKSLEKNKAMFILHCSVTAIFVILIIIRQKTEIYSGNYLP